MMALRYHSPACLAFWNTMSWVKNILYRYARTIANMQVYISERPPDKKHRTS